MTATESEIQSQYDALEQTLNYLDEARRVGTLAHVVGRAGRFVFLGSGSSYSISKSAVRTLRRYAGVPASAFSAGEVLVNTDEVISQFESATVIVPSRSGKTSEVLRALEKVKQQKSITVVAICMTNEAPIKELSDLVIELPWAFDESVCQTRTVTNLYAALLYVVAVAASQDSLIDEIRQMSDSGPAYIAGVREPLEAVARLDWSRAVVLADGAVAGIAEEGALAFKEICRHPSNFYNVLDSRHGPAVLFTSRTLIVAFLSNNELQLQKDVLSEYREKGCRIVAIGPSVDHEGVDLAIELPTVRHREVWGIPFIYVPQILSLSKALQSGVDPDQPTGLDPWIRL